MAVEGVGVRRRSGGGSDRHRVATRWDAAKAPIRHQDFSLFAVILALAVFGCVAIYSSSRVGLLARGADPHLYLKRQLTFLAISTVVFILMLVFDYRQLRNIASVFYAGALVLVFAVLTPIGHATAGAQRWINLGFMQIQPSELMKVALAISLAAWLAKRKETEIGLFETGVVLGRTAVPAMLIYLQPDMGTMMVLTAIAFTMLLVGGARARWLALVTAIGVVAFVGLLHFGLVKDYQIERLTGFLDPQNSNSRAVYNLEQSKLAVGAGGVTGRGLFRGTQTNLAFVPEQHTDFIFTAIAEETGFLGALLLVGLFAFLMWRGLRIAVMAKDRFGMVLAAGLTGMLAFQVFVNVGMTVGVMPITGIPLPFVSYGGSSLIASFAAVGLLMNIHMRRFL
jgi:rod shape determining protein RodA